MKEKIEKLIKYFESQQNVVMAFLFGSQAEGTEKATSDWDIGVYFKPYEYMEIETDYEYDDEFRIWSELIDILQTDSVDFIVLNRANPSLFYQVLTKGLPLSIKDEKLYLDLLCKLTYEAFDWVDFVTDYYEISKRAKSISPLEKVRLLRYLQFLENEFKEIDEIKKFTWQDYLKDSFKRKIIERWVENIIMATIDITKIIIASQKIPLPQTYKETLKIFGTLYVDENFGDKIAWFAIMRNIVVHEYLDIKWKRIKKFVSEAENTIPVFMEKVKEILNKA